MAGRAGTARMVSRPMLAPDVPILERGEDAIQVGLDDAALLIVGATAGWRRLLNRLDGRQQLADLPLLAGECGVDPELAEQLVEDLAAVNLLTDATTDAERERPACVHVVGEHPLSTDLCAVLRAEGIRATVATVARAASSSPDLVVLLSTALAVERVSAVELGRADLPYLTVHSSPTGAIVGPLVVPGVTACPLCMDLGRADVDPGWPGLVPQLERWTASWAPDISAWALGITVTHIQRFLRHPERRAASTWELSRRDHVQRIRQWATHPECSCQR